MYRRLQDGSFEDDTEAIREKLSQSVQTLEDRIGSLIDVAKSEVGAP